MDPRPLARPEWRRSRYRGWAVTAVRIEFTVNSARLIRTGKGGDVAYVMYRLSDDYELRVNWKPGSSEEWKTERIVCHNKAIEHTMNAARLKDTKASGLDISGCGEFLKLPDGAEPFTYKGIYIRALQPPNQVVAGYSS